MTLAEISDGPCSHDHGFSQFRFKALQKFLNRVGLETIKSDGRVCRPINWVSSHHNPVFHIPADMVRLHELLRQQLRDGFCGVHGDGVGIEPVAGTRRKGETEKRRNPQ